MGKETEYFKVDTILGPLISTMFGETKRNASLRLAPATSHHAKVRLVTWG
jgi:hypothetical protein